MITLCQILAQTLTSTTLPSGLFQRAILQSGTALLNNMYAPAREGAIAISNKLGCIGNESQQLLDCFMKASSEEMVDAQTALSVSSIFTLPV